MTTPLSGAQWRQSSLPSGTFHVAKSFTRTCRVSTSRSPTIDDMQIEITEDAQKLLERKGGTMSIDFIRPTG